MAEFYVRSTDGSDADDGSTWALAKATLAGAASAAAAGDTIYVSHVHAESSASLMTIAFAGTLSNPVRVLCVNDGAAPPTAEASTATVATTGNANISFTGSCIVKGVAFTAGSGGTSSPSFVIANGTDMSQQFIGCDFVLGGSNVANRIGVGNSAGGQRAFARLQACRVKFANASQAISVRNAGFHWNGGGILAASATPAALVNGASAGASGSILLENLDLTNLSTSFNVFGAAGFMGQPVIRNVTFASGWAGTVGAPTVAGQRYLLVGGDAAGSKIGRSMRSPAGELRSAATIFDGGNAGSWCLASSADANALNVLVSDEIYRHHAGGGGTQTVTVELLTDNVVLTNADCWLTVEYLGASGGATASSEKAQLAAASNLASSSATWTAPGVTTPTKQKLTVSVAPAEAGYMILRVHLARPSTTVYVGTNPTVA